MKAESTFSQRELKDLKCLPLPFHLNWIWLKEMQQMSCVKIARSLPFDSFPGFACVLSHSSAIVASLPAQNRDSPMASSLLTLPATCVAELLTLLSQLLNEVTRYFGPYDRGVNGSFPPI